MEKKVVVLFSFILIYPFLTLCANVFWTSQQEENRLTFLIVGGREGSIKRFGDISMLRQLFYSKEKRRAAEQFLLTIAQKPLSKEQILKQSRLSTEEINDVTTFLQSLNMIALKDNMWTTTLPVITGQEMITLRKNLSPLADKIALDVSSFIPQIKNIYAQNRIASDPEWDEMAHLFISYFLLDISFLRFLRMSENKKGIRQYYSERQNILPAFFLELGKNFTNFGCNSYSFSNDEKSTKVYVFVLHGTLFDRQRILVNMYENNPDFASALFKLIPQAKIQSFSDGEKKVFKAMNWMDKDEVLVPAMDGSVRKYLMPVVSKAAGTAAEEVFENFDVILDAFKNSLYSKFLDGAGDYIQYCYHVLMYLSIENLVQKGLLPPIPKPTPEYFGIYILYSGIK